MRRRDRGVSLLVAMGFVVIVALILGVAGQTYARLSESHRAALAREAALLEARSGVRWMALRLARGESAPLERADASGTLRVRVSGDRIESAFGDVRVSARIKRGATIELDDWKEE